MNRLASRLHMKPISIRPVPLRIGLLLALVVLCGWLGWSLVYAALGDSLATALQRAPNLNATARLKMADNAASYAPHDPLVRWERGSTYLAAANEEQNNEYAKTAVSELRAATVLSGQDARIWLALGKALARAGEPAEAKAALTKATQLAPHHFEPHWTLGNQLLRTGEREAAFAALQTALRQKPDALPLVFEYAWSFYQGDADAVIRALNPPPTLRAACAARLIAHNQVEAAMKLWQQNDTPATAAETKPIIESLQRIGRQRAAFDIWRKAFAEPVAEAGSALANGGFEQAIDLGSSAPFLTWQIAAPTGVTVGLDPQVFSAGALSLRLRFDVKENVALIVATQTAPVQPRTAYRLRCMIKTEELQSLSTPFISIQDAADDKRLSITTPAISSGSANWTEYKTDFVTTAATEAVTVRLMRMPCGEPPCPLKGRLWFDEFQLTQKSEK